MARTLSGNGRSITLGDHTLVMGIVNVTPDSFYDGGRHKSAQAAVEHGLRLVAQGAEMLDIGGESTRPGSDPLPVDEELDRVIPVIEGLASRTNVPLSIDTNKAAVARSAVTSGAHWINDISAGLMDPEMLEVVRETGVPYVAMHMRGTPKTMQIDTEYDDLIAEVKGYFEERLAACIAAGIDPHSVVLDPGIGFGKKPEHNYTLLARLEEFKSFNLPLLVGPSRKSFLKVVEAENAEDRLPGTLAAVVTCALAGVEIVRVHDVAESVQTVRVADRIRMERAQPA